jgi:hypothetical protein
MILTALIAGHWTLLVTLWCCVMDETAPTPELPILEGT